MTVRNYISRKIDRLKSVGVSGALRILLRRLRPYFKGATRKVLPYAYTYQGVTYQHGTLAKMESVPPRRINWAIPNFHAGSGGHRTIFRLTQALERAGYEVCFYIFGDTHFVSDAEATEAIRLHYYPLRARVRIGVEGMQPAMFCVASSWETAYAVRDFQACRRKIYFVQDYEPFFFPAGSERVLAEETYRFGFECICAGRWLEEKMRQFGNRAVSFELAFDPSIYSPRLKGPTGKRVVFCVRHHTPRRGTILGLLSLALLKETHPEVEVVLFGSPDLPYNIPFDFSLAGVLTEHELADLYRGASVGLSVSLTNYSLIPQEMLACGLPVVDIDFPPLRRTYPVDAPGIRLVSPTPEAIAKALSEVLFAPDSTLRQARESALLLVNELSWQRAEKTMLEFLSSDERCEDLPLAAA